MIRDQRRHADTEVYIESIAQFASDALHDALAGFDIVVGRWSFASRSLAIISIALAQWVWPTTKD